MHGNKNKVDELRKVLQGKATAKQKQDKGSPVAETKPAEATTSTDAGVSDADMRQMEEQIQAAEKEAKDHYDKLLRVMAEFENFKKRMEREKESFYKYSNEGIVCDLLPVIDNMDKVLEHIPEDAAPEVKAIADGVELVKKQLCDTLGKYGMNCVDAVGAPFDPNCHEAIAHVESDDDEGVVVLEHRKGYKLHDKLIRASMVSVSKGKKG